MRVAHLFLPRLGKVAVRSTDGGRGYGKAGMCGTPSTTRLRRAVPLPRFAREELIV
jgi:hypothetical protein